MSGTVRCSVGLVVTKKQWKWERKELTAAHGTSPRQEKKKKAVVLEDAGLAAASRRVRRQALS